MNQKRDFSKIYKFVGILVGAIALYFGIMYFVNSDVNESVVSEKIDLDTQNINNVEDGKELPLPSNAPSSKVASLDVLSATCYPWNGLTGLNSASGGAVTKAGSLMEKYNVNFKFFVRQEHPDIMNSLMTFLKDFHAGKNSPTDPKLGSQMIMFMGDGGPYTISTLQQMVDEIYGVGTYTIVKIAGIGMSYGEDALIAPAHFKNDPKQFVGKVISVVYGDGNWVLLHNYFASLQIPVNPNMDTYDPNAVNFYPSENGDFMKSGEELVNSVLNGFKVELHEVARDKDGKLKKTGKKVQQPITAMASWSPADSYVFEKLKGRGYTKIISTRDYNNQMPSTIVTIKEWADKNPILVENFLKAVYTANNQVKKYDNWRKLGARSNAEAFQYGNEAYWYNLFDGKEKVENGVSYFEGGSKVMNLSDAKQYYGLDAEGKDRYYNVWSQVSNYLKIYKPGGFDATIPDYNKAMYFSFLQNLRLDQDNAGEATKADYNRTATNVVASGEWKFNFAVGSDVILKSSYSDLESLFNLLEQAEESKISIIGHTDSTGDPVKNKELSKRRAEAVERYLVSKGVNKARIQSVSGLGQDSPVGDNATAEGRAKNRRTDVTLLK